MNLIEHLLNDFAPFLSVLMTISSFFAFKNGRLRSMRRIYYPGRLVAKSAEQKNHADEIASCGWGINSILIAGVFIFAIPVKPLLLVY
jgi:hypothetical protein